MTLRSKRVSWNRIPFTTIVVKQPPSQQHRHLKYVNIGQTTHSRFRSDSAPVPSRCTSFNDIGSFWTTAADLFYILLIDRKQNYFQPNTECTEYKPWKRCKADPVFPTRISFASECNRKWHNGGANHTKLHQWSYLISILHRTVTKPNQDERGISSDSIPNR